MKTDVSVSIIIVNYNTLEITKHCIDSIFEHTSEVDFEVIVVDNDSCDGSKDMLSADSRIVYIKSRSNLGFGKANNLGMKYAKGKYIFLLNSDTILLNNAVKYFFDSMERMPNNVACLGTILLAADGITKNNSYGDFPSLSNTFMNVIRLYFRFGKAGKRENRNSDSFKVDYIIGADLFIRQEVIEKVGLFDPDFFMYFEETEMQLRYSQLGYESRIIFTPSIIHLECVSADGGSKLSSIKQRLMYFHSMFIYMKKRYGWFKYLLFRVLVISYLPTFHRIDKSNFKSSLKLFFFTS